MADYAAAVTPWGGSNTTLLDLMKLLAGVTGSTRDVEFSGLLQVAGEAAEQYTDRVLAEDTVIDMIARSRSPVTLHHPEFQSLTTVEVDGVDVSADYETFNDGGLTYLASSRSGATKQTSFNQMVVTYVAGFDPLPTNLAYTIVRMAMIYEQQSEGGVVRRESVVGVGSFEFDTTAALQANVGGLPDSARAVLDRYRRLQA